MNMSTGLCTAILLGLLTGCSVSNKQPIPHISEVLMGTTKQDGRACVRIDRIDSFGVLKHKVVSINATPNYYLATVFPGCLSLDTSNRALFKDRFGEICGGSNSKLSVEGDNCVIRHIFEFANRAEAFAAYEMAVTERDRIARLSLDKSRKK